MSKTKNSFIQLFLTNFRGMYRNWRGLFFNVILPIGLYVFIGKVVSGKAPGTMDKINYSDYLLPGIIAMTIMQTGIYSLAYWLIDLRAKGVLKRLFVTPISKFEMVSSLISSRIVLMAFQVVLLIVIGVYYMNAHLLGSLPAVLILLVIGGATFLSIGFFISSIAGTYEEAAPLTTVMNLMFTFLGNIFFPTQGLPKAFQLVGSKLPATYLAEGMRHNFVEHWTLRQSLPDIMGLLVWLIIALAATAYTFKTKQD